MMSSMFSMFDPSSGNYNLNWLSLLIVLCLFPVMWVNVSSIEKSLVNLYFLILKEMKSSLKFYFSVGMGFFSLFWCIFMVNFSSLLVYVFSSSSHFSLNFSVSFVVWISFMLSGWLGSYNDMFAHLVPLGSPMILSPILVLIESISNVIRPLTLAIRLMANLIAGHVILSLLGSMGVSLIYMVVFIQIPFEFLEMFVSFIQAYVFMMLSISYWSEVE